jgi:ketosteroid isomerase-like protein
MSLMTLTSSPASFDTRINEWIKSSLESHPIAKTLKRVAFVMPIDGADTLVLVNQKNGDILAGNALPVDSNINDTLEIDGTFWTYIQAPDGAAEAYGILCDTQSLEPLADAIDEIIPEEVVGEAPSVETTHATLEERPMTIEQIDNLMDAALADLGRIDTTYLVPEQESTVPDPTTATRRTLIADDTVASDDAAIANEVLAEVAAEDAEEAAETAQESTDAKPAKKPKAIRLPVRDRIVNKLVDKLGLTSLPSLETMFAKFANAQHIKKVKLANLAVFNNSLAFDGDRTEVGKALNDLADAFGSENILNESAEIQAGRVVEVATALLRHGRIVHLVKAAKIDGDTIPESVKAAHEGLDSSILQVWDGRHRTAGLVLLYGAEAIDAFGGIPMLVEDKTYEEAYDDALISNDTRDYGKKEAMTYFGLTSEIQTDGDIAKSFALCKGSAPALMKWIGYHTTSKRDSDTLEALSVPTYDTVPKGKEGMTTPSYGNIIKGAMSVYGKDALTNLEDAKPYINATIRVINAAWDYIKANAPERINNIWTSYGTQVLGKVIGEAFSKAVAAETEFDPSKFAENMMKAVLGLISVNSEVWSNLKPSELYVALHDYASGKGITLARAKKPGGAASILKQN